MVTDADRELAANLINKMWIGDHFSICEIDKCLTILELGKSPSYAALQKYHCVHFSDMPPGLKDELLVTTLQLLSQLSVKQLVNSAIMKEARGNAEQLVENTLKKVSSA
jgi:hypothetical protein